MKILYLNPIGRIGGGERVLLDVLASLPAVRPDVERRLLLLEDGPLATAARELGVEVDVLPGGAAVQSLGDSGLRTGGRVGAALRLATRALLAGPQTWRLVRQLRRHVAQVAPDVVHSNGIKTHLLTGLARLRDVRLVWHVHDFVSTRPLVASLLRRVAGRAAPVAVSAAVAQDVESWLPSRRANVVMNGIDTARFSPAPADAFVHANRLDALAGFARPAKELVRIGLVATYARWKGQDVYLRAAARLLDGSRASQLRFYIIGGPIYSTPGSQFTRHELTELAHSLGVAGRVGFIDFQPDPAPVYRSLDVVVHASTQPEPFGLTIAEAMSCGRPIIVAAAGGAVELFRDGVDALSVPPGDVEQLANAIHRLAADPALRARLGAAARATALARFGRDRMTRELAAIYDRLAAADPQQGPPQVR